MPRTYYCILRVEDGAQVFAGQSLDAAARKLVGPVVCGRAHRAEDALLVAAKCAAEVRAAQRMAEKSMTQQKPLPLSYPTESGDLLCRCPACGLVDDIQCFDVMGLEETGPEAEWLVCNACGFIGAMESAEPTT